MATGGRPVQLGDGIRGAGRPRHCFASNVPYYQTNPPFHACKCVVMYLDSNGLRSRGRRFFGGFVLGKRTHREGSGVGFGSLFFDILKY